MSLPGLLVGVVPRNEPLFTVLQCIEMFLSGIDAVGDGDSKNPIADVEEMRLELDINDL